MFDPEALKRLAEERAAWEARELAEFLARQPEARTDYRTGSGMPVQRLYTPEDIADAPADNIGLPGRFPYTRGPYPTMYRGRNWTMRQIAGFGTGEDTNGRFRYLIEHGQTGLSVDFDMPTLMGYDSDDPRSLGEVGREGVAIDTLDDMEALFADIDLERISVSMTINPSAWILLAMYVALAESRGFDLNKLSGTVQADILKEYIAQKEWIFPIRPSMRIMRDMIVYCARNMARYNPINISGYHISEAGATSVQEVAFTMATRSLREEGTGRGAARVELRPRLAFYSCPEDFFEEVAKFRAPGASTPAHEGALGATKLVHAVSFMPDRGSHSTGAAIKMSSGKSRRPSRVAGRPSRSTPTACRAYDPVRGAMTIAWYPQVTRSNEGTRMGIL